MPSHHLNRKDRGISFAQTHKETVLTVGNCFVTKTVLVCCYIDLSSNNDQQAYVEKEINSAMYVYVCLQVVYRVEFRLAIPVL